MSYVYSAAIYSPGEGKTVKNLEDEARGWRGEIASSRSTIDYDELERETAMPRHEMQYRLPKSNGAPGTPHSAPPRHEDDEYHNETVFFERNRIKQLQDERVHIQKKTFTKWCNSFLSRARLEIVDLFADVGDGVLLMKLLEIISGDKLGKPNRGRMRVQKIENLNKVLDFLKKKKIQLENIGAEDILDRNERLILGLIWTIILRFQIDTIVIEDEELRGERKFAKEALLIWCQRKTAGYHNVRVENFTTSWRSGLAFNALIHAHRPELINYNALNPNDHVGNLNNAFDVAEKKLEIARLLDAEDVDSARPDEKSIITYLSSIYHHFAKQKTEMTGARRVANIVGKLMESERSEDDYQAISSDLLRWIRETITMLENRRFPNSLQAMRDELTKFNKFRTEEKQPKYKEKGDLEALFFTIQTKRNAMKRKAYLPPEGLFMHDIETAWTQLERAENSRQLAIIAQIQRQEKLEKMAQRFYKTAGLREGWLRQVKEVLDTMDVQGNGKTAVEVENAVKKQQALSTDVLSKEPRFKQLSAMCVDLTKENYHENDKIRAREREVIERYTQFLSRLEQKRTTLMNLNDLMSLLRDIDALMSELKLLEPGVRNRDVGKHLDGVQYLLEQQELLEKEITQKGDLLAKNTRDANTYIRKKGEQHEVLQRKLEDVTHQYNTLVELCRARRVNLEKAKELFQFIQDHGEEMAWLEEKEQICKSALAKADISAVHQTTLQFKHVETEMQLHWKHSKELIALGERLLQSGQPKDDIQRRIAVLQKSWERLREIVQSLGQWLDEAKKAQQYFQDANEAESWIREKMPLVKSDDLGRDELAAESLLQRHHRLEEDINSYRADISRLDEMAAQLVNSGFHNASTSTVEEEKTNTVPKLEMMYKYSGNGINVAQGEIIALLEKSNDDWWRVFKQDGTEGYVPANWCRPIPGETVTVTVHTTKKSSGAPADGRTAITDRQKTINHDYRQLNKLAEVRRRLLSDNIKLMRFYRECNEFETWGREVENALADEPTVEHVKAFRAKFDKLEADIKTNGGLLLKTINQMADELIGEGHGQSPQIEARRKKVNALWAEIDRLRKMRSSRLEATERVADFEASCDDTKSWMQSKFDVLDRKPQDLKSLQSLERDLKPLEDKIRSLEKLAAEVKKNHPEEAAIIEKQIAELKRLHAELLGRADDKIKQAEQTQGRGMFDSAYRDIMGWVERTKKTLAEDVHAVDVQQADELQKKHYELGEQIKDKKYGVDYVNELGRRLLDKNPRLHDVDDQLRKLAAEMDLIRSMYRAKDAKLKEQLELQLFNREAERIDTATKGHEAFLDYADLGDSVESVENLLKRHRDLEAKLDAQRARLEAFSRNADDLIQNKHSDSDYIDKRRNDVLAHRNKVHMAAADRRRALEASLEYQNLRRDAEEMIGWINEKKRLASDDSHKDLTNIANKLLKHEAFEAEIGANQPRIEEINRTAAGLMSKRHPESANVDAIAKNVNAHWNELLKAVHKKGDNLRQASDQKGLNRILEDAHSKLDELEVGLRSDELGSDLRAVKELIQKHAVLEQEMTIHKRRLSDIQLKGHKMTEKGHFDSDKISNTIAALLMRFDQLSGPAAARKAALEESRKWHQLAFDVDCELQWIAEKRPIAASEDSGRSLTESKNMVKKQDQLEAEVLQHSVHIDETLAQGDKLIHNGHRASQNIRDKCNQLSESWKDLAHLVQRRRKIVDWGVKEQQYLFDAAEVESWMNEKRAILVSEEYGSDEDAAQKQLARHKALQNDMVTYKQWLDNLAVKCAELTSSGRPNVERFAERQAELEAEFEKLSKLADQRRKALEDTVCLYEYMREGADLEQWINDQLTTAMNEDYGEDYEHLKELQSKFAEFKQSVKTGSDRFVLSEESAKALLRRNPPFARDVVKKQEKLRTAWTVLLEYIQSRENKLDSAEELHKFNRDVGEHEEWVMDKTHNMSQDLGRDVKQVHTLTQQHETLENEVSAMEPRLEKLLEESVRLRQIYPGGNAEHVAHQQAALAAGWQDLKNATADRRDLLRASDDLHRFLGGVRDLLSWTELTIADMQSEIHINDLQQAEWLEKEHSRLSNEIDAREPEFDRLIKSGKRMIQAGHYASDEIKERIAMLEQGLSRLRVEWDLRNNYLAQNVQWHAFKREASQIIAAISSKRTTLRSLAVGRTVADVEGQTKRLETFAKALSTLQERSKALCESAQELIEARHPQRKNIDAWREKVVAALAELRADVEHRRAILAEAYALASFNSDVADMEAWIDEKLKGIRAELERQGQCVSIEDKMKRLQRHQALEAELSANKKRVDQVLQRGRELFARHNNSEITASSEALLERWSLLVNACSDQSRALEEFRDLLTFRQLVDRVLHWIRDKELMVATGEMGRDLEHCKMLLSRLDGSTAGSSVDEQTLEEINRLGEKLVSQGRSSREEVHEQQQHLNQTWRSLHGKIAAYRKELTAALEVHAFNRDVYDTDERISEKTAAMRNEDYGRDFASVDALVRKQNALENDMSAIHNKLMSHDQEAQILLAKNAPLRDSICESLKKLEKSWKELSEAAEHRSEKLDRSYKLHKYLENVRKSEAWSAQLRGRMTSYQQPRTSAEARLRIEQHQERKAEIDGRQEELKLLHEEGQRLISEQPEHKPEVQRAHKRVQNSEHQLLQSWESEKSILQKTLDWLVFCDQALIAEQWLSDKENVLKQGDLGDNTDAVEMLIKSHEAFVKTTLNQSTPIESLKARGAELLQTDSDFKSDIASRMGEIEERYEQLISASKRRTHMLNDSKKYHDFIRTCGELITWITAKLQLAYDESYLDPINLRSKLQKHLAFDSELTENEKRLTTVEVQGQKLIQEKHFMSEQVAAQLTELRGGWDELRTKSALKTQRLREAFDAHNLHRKVEDMERWLDKVESDLGTEDHGRDLESVDLLMKKLDALDAEIRGRSEAVADLMAKARDLKTRGSATSEAILNRAEQVEARFGGLDQPIRIRRENLRDARLLFEWLDAAEEELEWLADKLPLARSQDYGDSLHAAMSLQKKHTALEKELESRESSITDSESKGVAMIDKRHFASADIHSKIAQINNALSSVKAAVATRRARLIQAVESQQYYTEVAEAEQWVRDQMPLAANNEIGKDQASTESHLRRLAVLDKEVAQFRSEVDRLRGRADALLAHDSQDATQINSRQTRLETSFNNLVAECTRRRTQLVDAGRYYRFVRQVQDLSDWLHEKEKIAGSEEYGRDLEDCLQLAENFDTVLRELAAAGERVAAVQRTQEELLRSGHPYTASISAKGTDLQQLWKSVNTAANDRQNDLIGAKQVHRFDQEADQTLNWLQDKEVMGVAMEQEDLSQADLGAIKAQMQRHDEFVHGLKAVEKQVTELCRDAERLCSLFPNTKDHLAVRTLDMKEQLRDILEGAQKHYEKLQHMENLQAYFQEYRELIQWMKRLQTSITSEQLPRDVPGCEALARRHEEYFTEIQGRKSHVDGFVSKGRHMISKGHILAQEIGEKVEHLEKTFIILTEVWKDRDDLYKENTDCKKWYENAGLMERWLMEREGLLRDDWRAVESVEAAENHLRDFDDFLVTLDAQNERCEMVKQLTLVEKNFSRLKHKESERARTAEQEQRRRDTIKVVEKGDILASRRQERERRKTQEISLMRPSQSEDAMSQTLPRKERSKTAVIQPPTFNDVPIGSGASTSNSNLVGGEDTRTISSTPIFTPRRQSIRSIGKPFDATAIAIKGYLDRKHDLACGKKATLRSWKNFYAILCGHYMSFFKDEEHFAKSLAQSSITIYGAQCETYPEYKRKNAFRLSTTDGSHYIFTCPDEQHMFAWVSQIKFHARLPPSNQLESYPASSTYNVGELAAAAELPPVPPRRTRDGTLISQTSSDTDTTAYSRRADSQVSTSTISSYKKTTSSYQESLSHQEHTTVPFEARPESRPEGSEFISWVESNQPGHPPSHSHHVHHEDTDSIKSGSKKRVFSIFRRGSKASNK